MTPYSVVFITSAVVTFATTPLARRLAFRLGAIAHPSDRTVHPVATPQLGGLAMFIGMVAALAVTWALPEGRLLYRTSSELTATLVAGTLIFAVGLYDDVKGTIPVGKLAGQVLAAGVLVLMGVQMLYVWFPGQGIISMSPDLSVPLTILWVLAMVNAVNLIDGLDGLAAGMVAIAAGAFFLFVYQAPGLYGDLSPAGFISAITVGMCIGFLPWNFNPAKIFMGDSGAMLLGLLLAVATISGVGRNAYPPSGGDVAAFSIPVLLPLILLAIPFLDVALAILRRVRSNKPVSHADKEHIHHRLLDIGHSHRQAVLLMYLWSALLAGCALAVAFIDGRLVAGIVVTVLMSIFLVTFIPRMIGNGRRSGEEEEVAGERQ
jgi:UDP-GlcNAc:undecaprenyl-phosphate/decaprenyl-phosphate GlcNAc-1-phosphate transferase